MIRDTKRQKDGRRLVTMPGGTGKTELRIELTRHVSQTNNDKQATTAMSTTDRNAACDSPADKFEKAGIDFLRVWIQQKSALGASAEDEKETGPNLGGLSGRSCSW